jgi:parvulin-like peptidyl-prolyl isomerase
MRAGLFGPTLAVIIALGAPGSHAAGDVVAQHGTITLTTDDVRQMLAALDPLVRDKIQHDPAALTNFVRERLVQQILLQEARDKKWDQRPEIVAAANQARDAAIVTSYLLSVSAPDAGYPSDAEIQAAYDANKPRFLVPRQYQLAQIFIAVPAGSARAVDEEAKKKLLELRTQATKPRTDFAAVAKQNSQDRATVDKGGDLGWLREDKLAPEVRTAVAGLQEGGLSEPVRMPDGWHLLKLTGTKPASTAPLADVKATLAEALRKQRTQQNAQAYAAATLRVQPAQIDEITLGKLTTK